MQLGFEPAAQQTMSTQNLSSIGTAKRATSTGTNQCPYCSAVDKRWVISLPKLVDRVLLDNVNLAFSAAIL